MRDRDVRNAMKDALLSTGAFNGVYLTGLPEDFGGPASDYCAAAIEPESSDQEPRWDAASGGGLLVTSRVTITFLARHDDPQLRDELAEQLLEFASNALNGQQLGGLVLPQSSRLSSWRWSKPESMERRISATFSYQYLLGGWDVADISD